MRRVHAAFRKLLDWLVTTELWLAVVLFTLTGVVITVEIFARRVLNTPFVWAEDLTVFLFVWTSFLGAAILYDRRAALSIDTLTSHLAPRTRAHLAIVVDVILFVALVYLTRLSYDFVAVQHRLGHKLGGATGIPSYMMTLAVLVAMTTMLLSTAAALIGHCVPAGQRRQNAFGDDAPRASAADSG